MAEPKLLLTDDEYEEIKILAARQRVRPQDFMREAVRSAMTAGVPVQLRPRQENEMVLSYLSLIAAKRPILAQDLVRLITHMAKECEDGSVDPLATADDAIRRAQSALGKAEGNTSGKKRA